MAEAYVEYGPAEDKSAPGRRMSDWSAQTELLTAILNRLGEMTQALASLGGAKPRPVPPAPVPVGALEKVRNRRRLQKHKSLVARLLPNRGPDPRS
jgi:hypothetical protein